MKLGSSEGVAELRAQTLAQSARPRLVELLGRPAAASGSPRTAVAARLLGGGGGWELDNVRTESAAAAEAYAALGLQQFVRQSERLNQDCLWHSGSRQFVVCFAFSRWCMGPPGLVHGGCLFACLDDAITRLLFSRAVTDLGAKGGLMLTANMQVDYKGGVPLDAEYCVVVGIAQTSVDTKGRTRYRVRASLYQADGETAAALVGRARPHEPSAADGAEEEALTIGIAEFVETDRPWAGQVGGAATAAL